MQVRYHKAFQKDLLKADPSIRKRIHIVIAHFEAATELHELQQVKKLKGHKDAYRIRVGHFRLGFFLVGNEVHLARLLDRKEVYRFFP